MNGDRDNFESPDNSLPAVSRDDPYEPDYNREPDGGSGEDSDTPAGPPTGEGRIRAEDATPDRQDRNVPHHGDAGPSSVPPGDPTGEGRIRGS